MINTGLSPGSKVITKPLRPSFIDGLLAIVTGGIFTPMTYRITCATESAMTPDTIQLHVARGDSTALTQAAALSPVTGHAVYVRF